ncbi:MAG: NUDIX domain-containing protein [Candidatus Nanopelagicales bacterium]
MRRTLDPCEPVSDPGVPGDHTTWPDFDVERTSVRVVLLDPGGRLLLFATVDPTMPETGTWWELPGGGMEPGETVAQTAVREIAEETGFALTVEQVEPTRWRRSTTYLRRHVRTLQHEHVVVARLDRAAPGPEAAGRTPQELQEYVGHRWWSPARVRRAGAAGERFFPGRLPELLAPMLAGDTIDEPFELWN